MFLVPEDLEVGHLCVFDLDGALGLVELVLGPGLALFLFGGREEAVLDCFILLYLAVVLELLQRLLIGLDLPLLHHVVVVAQHLVLLLQLALQPLFLGYLPLGFVVLAGQSLA